MVSKKDAECAFFPFFFSLLRLVEITVIPYNLFVQQGKELRTGWGVGTRLGCCQIEWVAIICILIFSNFWQKSFKKKKKEKKNESAISRQTWMRAGALRQNIFFLFSLSGARFGWLSVETVCANVRTANFTQAHFASGCCTLPPMPHFDTKMAA